MDPTFLLDIGLIILVAALGALVVRFLRQPVILGYILAGIIIGPAILGLVQNSSLILTLSELGIAFLLFFVGLELDFSKLKKMGGMIATLGIVQVVLVTVAGGLIALKWFDFTQALYIGLALAFSSTMIVIKLLSDKRELDSLHGRIILGILLVQDILVVMIIPFLGTLGSVSASVLILAVIKIMVLFLVAYISKVFIFKNVMKYITDSAELLFVASVAVCFLFIGLSYFLGFSIAIGGFIAGISLATRPYNLEIAGRVKALKDFFAVLFFVTLGSQLTFFNMTAYIPLLLALLAVILFFKPFIIFLILKVFKYSNRPAVFASSQLAQISEFSLILAVQGIALGHLTQDVFNIIVVLAIVTITITTYIIKHSEGFYSMFSVFFVPFENMTSKKDLEKLPKRISGHTILFGGDRMGSQVVESYEKKKDKLIVVDFNPELVRKLIKKGYNCIYGDYSNHEILESVKLDQAKMIISTIPSINNNSVIIELAKGMNKKALVMVTAKTLNEALTLYDEGADFVALPQVLAGQKISEYMKKFDANALKRRGDLYHKKLKRERARNDIID
jgi:Kef-type K+ transport system membrane component KefB